ncbi:hypothetical protein Lepto7375DRAFT_1740 [Leptolyngbya sp. PCC 7375]|nr:hypothetical protein Lepto7375DRAFT_1740 [Leptolyngbya sp. PCC 7375]
MTSEIPSLTAMVDAVDKIHEAFGGSDPIDTFIRQDAYRLYDIAFGATPGTTKRIYVLRQTAEKGWI